MEAMNIGGKVSVKAYQETAASLIFYSASDGKTYYSDEVEFGEAARIGRRPFVVGFPRQDPVLRKQS
jgi:hypothetical protein